LNRTDTILQAQRIQKRLERLYLKKVYNAIRSQDAAFIADLKMFGIDGAKSRLDATLVNRDIADIIADLYQVGALATAKETYKTVQGYEAKLIKKGEKMFVVSEKFLTIGLNEQWSKDVQQYFKLYLLEKAVLPITETTKKNILATLLKATEEGWSIEQIVSFIQAPDVNRRRAETIVRTESVRATNFGGMLAAYESKLVMQKRWIEAKDTRTRRSHKHATGVGGEIRDLLERFSNGLLFPGDPEGGAKETINCRCTLGYIPKRDAEGKLIRKPEQPQQQGRSIYRTSLVDVLSGLLIGLQIGDFFNDN